MIIRITVNDNDFTEYLERFSKNLDSKLLSLVEIICSDDNIPVDEKINAHRDWDRTFKLLNPNCTTSKNITENDKAFMRQQINIAWELFISKHITSEDAEDNGLKYLLDNFECNVGYDFKDMWENGEAVYYFTTAQMHITQ